MEGRILSHYKVMKKLGGGRMGCGMLSVLNSLSGRRRELDQSPPQPRSVDRHLPCRRIITSFEYRIRRGKAVRPLNVRRGSPPGRSTNPLQRC